MLMLSGGWAAQRVGFAVGMALMCSLLWCSAVTVAADDPRQCIIAAGRAVDQADVATFEQLVDVDAVLEQALDIFVRRASDPEVAPTLPPMVALLFSQAAVREGGVRTLLLNETRSFVLYGVASGAFAGHTPSGSAAQGLLTPLFADASTGRKEVRHVGQARPDDNGWLVPFIVHDHGNGVSYAVTGRVTATDNGLRLTSVENMEELLERMADERRALEQ